jgi:hypothetical protein
MAFGSSFIPLSSAQFLLSTYRKEKIWTYNRIMLYGGIAILRRRRGPEVRVDDLDKASWIRGAVVNSNRQNAHEIAIHERYAHQAASSARGPRRDRDRLRAELAAELELAGDGLVDLLLELGITPDKAPAFEALPLVEVAWADAAIDEEERWRVLAGATAFGLELGSSAHAQLELWLTRRPPRELFEAWRLFAARGLTQRRAALRARRLLEEAREVAKAAGGFFGFGAVSGSERETVSRIREALGHKGGFDVR